MLSRIRAFLMALLVKTPVRIALGLVAFYFVFGWFGFEPLAKWLAPKIVADKSHHHLSLAEAKFDPLALSLRVKGLDLKEPDGKPLLAFDELFVDFEAASLFKWAYTFQDIRLVAPHAQVALLANGQLNWTALIEAFKSDEDEPDKPLPRLLVRHLALEKGRVDLADRRVGFETGLNPIDFTLDDLSTLPDDKGSYALAATTRLGARIRWKGELSLTPTIATGQLGIDQIHLTRVLPYLQTRLNMAPPEGQAELSLNYRVAWVDKKLSLVVDRINAHLEKLALRGKDAAEPAVRLDSLALTDGRFDLDKRTLDIGGIALQGGRIQVSRDQSGRLDIQDWFIPLPLEGGGAGERVEPTSDQKTQKPTLSHTAGTLSPQGRGETPPWHIRLGGFSLDGLGIGFRDAGFRQPLGVEVDNVKLGFSANAEVGGAATQARVEGLGVEIGGVRLTSGGAKPFFTLGGISLADGRADLAEQSASLGSVTLRDGALEVVREAGGKIALLDVFQPLSLEGRGAGERVGPGSDQKTQKPTPTQALPPRGGGRENPWRYGVGEVGLAGFQVAVRDETVQPAARLTLERINASVKGVSQDLKQALPVKLSLAVKEGGAFQAEGKVIPAKPAADLRLVLNNLSLKPAQPFVSQAANLTLASGAASGSGRLKYDGKLAFDGGFRVADLLLNESESGERFLAWKTLASDSVSYRPAALDIDELRLDGLGAKLVIDKDKTVNLKKILKAQTPPPAGQAAAAAPPAPAKTEPSKAEPATRMTIDRVRVENGELDFADLSLALPFGTRIHHFKGAINGISSRSPGRPKNDLAPTGGGSAAPSEPGAQPGTQPGSAAQLELDGQVDEYGLARAVGQLDLFDPTAFMDIKVVFRNVEMTRLTPYTATFVGRKIDSGKLSLDLEYKIKQRELLGENQIIMDKLTLGERVESPTAKQLPLDLAIAILQDSDGRIDLGLPVSGSLDDPQFSYGRIIWKAIGNILTKIVTAPFRALASLFGGSGEKLEKIAFEAGEAGLTPPEKEKLKQIATVLNKRPGLALTVHPAWSGDIDRSVVREARLRRAVAEKMGLKLRPDEEPGPISTANPKVQAALEGLYAARFGEEDWKKLQAKWLQANPEKKQESGAGKLMSRLKGLFKKDEPLSEVDMQALKGTDLHALLYERLLAKETVGDADLQALARQRGEAVVSGLVGVGAPSERVRTGEPESFGGEGREVPARMELAVAKAKAKN